VADVSFDLHYPVPRAARRKHHSSDARGVGDNRCVLNLGRYVHQRASCNRRGDAREGRHVRDLASLKSAATRCVGASMGRTDETRVAGEIQSPAANSRQPRFGARHGAGGSGLGVVRLTAAVYAAQACAWCKDRVFGRRYKVAAKPVGDVGIEMGIMGLDCLACGQRFAVFDNKPRGQAQARFLRGDQFRVACPHCSVDRRYGMDLVSHFHAA
jgi:hypothetical protein